VQNLAVLLTDNLTDKEREGFERYASEFKKMEENPNQSVGILAENWAKETPNKIALYYEEKSWTWKTFNEESNKFANYFHKLGIKQDETVIVMMWNSPKYLFLTTGINKLQGRSALVNIHQRKTALIHAITIVKPVYAVVDGDCLPYFEDVVKELSFKKNEIFVINNPKKIAHDYVDLNEELKIASVENPSTTNNSELLDIGTYIYTSGTTGLPKAVMMRNDALVWNGVFYGYSVSQANSNDTVYIPNPLYHSLAMCTAWGIASYFGATVALRRKFSASNFWKDVKKYNVTFTTYVGEIPRYLLNQPPSEEDGHHTLKKMLGLGLKKNIWSEFKSRFNIEHIFEYYSSTEGFGPISNFDEKPGMIGRHVLEVHALAKVNPETNEFYKDEQRFYIKCKPGEIGMSLMKIEDIDNFYKYSEKDKTNQRVIRNVFIEGDAFFITGDILKLHDDLWLSFMDRIGDTFRFKGENVATQEVENIINTHPGILHSAIYGVELPQKDGKAGMGALELNPSKEFNLDEFSQFVTEVLPSYSIPIFLRIREELEVTGSQKIRKVNLRKDGYNLDKIRDPIYFWDASRKVYVPFDDKLYQDIVNGKIIL